MEDEENQEAEELDLAVAAQVEFESKICKRFIIFQFQALGSGRFNVGFIGSTCTALPSRRRAARE